jgi:acetyl-CoA carboxylase carboxyltransferase component
MRRKKSRKKHSVKASFRVMELAKAGSSIELEIFASKEKIGTLKIGRGSLFWYGRSRHKSKRIAWSRFAEMMDELAYGKRRQ